jgi:hypothetical protein
MRTGKLPDGIYDQWIARDDHWTLQ